jgi:hypothetical protein
MTNCATHVAHAAKFKGSDVNIIEIQEVKKNRWSPKVEIIATSGRKCKG